MTNFWMSHVGLSWLPVAKRICAWRAKVPNECALHFFYFSFFYFQVTRGEFTCTSCTRICDVGSTAVGPELEHITPCWNKLERDGLSVRGTKFSTWKKIKNKKWTETRRVTHTNAVLSAASTSTHLKGFVPTVEAKSQQGPIRARQFKPVSVSDSGEITRKGKPE